MVLDDAGNLYCGGDFTSVDSLDANRVAMWNGSTWTALGDGLNAKVQALAYSDGVLYAGGQFTEAGGAAARNVAMWDGTQWSPLSSGPFGIVYALAVVGDDLFVGGLFEYVGGLKANNIARWDGEEWHTLGVGTNGSVNALTSNGTTLIAGGKFTLNDGVPVNRIAQWDGSEWTPLGSGVDQQVFALAQSGNDLYAGGEFTRAGNLPNGRMIARWDGTAWSGLGGGIGSTVYAITVNDQDVFVGTTRSVIQWNGTTWIQLGSGTNGLVRALTNRRLNLFVGGDFSTAGDKESTFAAEAITAFEARLSVELPEDSRLEDEGIVNWGDVAVDSSARYVFTVRNTGNLALSVSDIRISGGEDRDSFEVDPGNALEPVAPEDSKTFSVTFAPTEEGEKTATLALDSNDPNTLTFTQTLDGSVVSARELFDEAMADADLSEEDADADAMPFTDGVENVLKYAFNMDLTGADSATLQAGGESGLPRYTLIDKDGRDFFRFEFIRRKGSGLIYSPLKSSDLDSTFTMATGNESLEDIDLDWERVLFDVAVDLSAEPVCFGRMMVELPTETR